MWYKAEKHDVCLQPGVCIWVFMHIYPPPIPTENNLPGNAESVTTDRRTVSHNRQGNQPNKWRYPQRGMSCLSSLDLDLGIFSTYFSSVSMPESKTSSQEVQMGKCNRWCCSSLNQRQPRVSLPPSFSSTYCTTARPVSRLLGAKCSSASPKPTCVGVQCCLIKGHSTIQNFIKKSNIQINTSETKTIIQRTSDSKSCFFGRLNKMDKTLAK